MNTASHTPHSASTAIPRWLLLMLLLATAAWFGTLGSRSLLNPDEGRYAEIAREMLTTGDWVTPRLNALILVMGVARQD